MSSTFVAAVAPSGLADMSLSCPGPGVVSALSYAGLALNGSQVGARNCSVVLFSGSPTLSLSLEFTIFEMQGLGLQTFLDVRDGNVSSSPLLTRLKATWLNPYPRVYVLSGSQHHFAQLCR